MRTRQIFLLVIALCSLFFFEIKAASQYDTPMSCDKFSKPSVYRIPQTPDILKVGELSYKLHVDAEYPIHGEPFIVSVEASVVGCDDFTDESLVIPGCFEWEGYIVDVTRIDTGAFRYNEHIKNVYMSGRDDGKDAPSITLQKESFAYCQNLKDVFFERPAVIEDEAFNGSESLEKIWNDNLGVSISSLLINQTSLKSFTLGGCIISGDPISNNSLEKLSFSNCDFKDVYAKRCNSLDEITFENCQFRVTTVGMVYGCSNLKKATVTDNVSGASGLFFQNCHSLTDVKFVNIIPDGRKMFDKSCPVKNVEILMPEKFIAVEADMNIACENLSVSLISGDNEVSQQYRHPLGKIKLIENDYIRNVKISHPNVAVTKIDARHTPVLKSVSQSRGYLSADLFNGFTRNPFEVFRCGDIHYIGEKAFTDCSGLGETFGIVVSDDEQGCDIYGDIFCSSTVNAVSIEGNAWFHDGTFGKLDKLYIGHSEYPLVLGGKNADTKGGFSGCDIEELIINRELSTTIQPGMTKEIHAFADAKVGTLILKGLTEIPENALLDGEFNIVDIASTVESIEPGNLEGAKSINIVISRSTVPPVLKMDAYAGIAPDIRIVVPEESIEAYKTAEGWRDFSRFEALKTVGIDEVADGLADEPVEIYTLDGRRVATNRDALTPGLYIVRTASGKTFKIAIR